MAGVMEVAEGVVVRDSEIDRAVDQATDGFALYEEERFSPGWLMDIGVVRATLDLTSEKYRNVRRLKGQGKKGLDKYQKLVKSE